MKYNIRSMGYGLIVLIFFTKVQISSLDDNTLIDDKMWSKNTLNHFHRITNLQQSTKISLVFPAFKPENP